MNGDGLSHRWLSIALFVATTAGMTSAQSGLAQTLPGFNQPQNQSSSILTPTNQTSSAPTSGLPANVLTPSTTNQLAPNTGPSSSFGRPKDFGSAGQGLPGMRGGPPINSPVGAQEPHRRLHAAACRRTALLRSGHQHSLLISSSRETQTCAQEKGTGSLLSKIRS